MARLERETGNNTVDTHAEIKLGFVQYGVRCHFHAIFKPACEVDGCKYFSGEMHCMSREVDVLQLKVCTTL